MTKMTKLTLLDTPSESSSSPLFHPARTHFTSDDLSDAGPDDDTLSHSQLSHLDYLDPTPAYEEISSSHHTHVPPPLPISKTPPTTLRILGATWGGINVTRDLTSMVRPLTFHNHADTSDTLHLDMRTIWTLLMPDPASGCTKILTLLYQYGDDDQGQPPRLLVLPEGCPDPVVHIDKDKFHDVEESRRRKRLITLAGPGWKTTRPPGEVEILAVVYGPERIETPAVLEELAKFFEGKRGQVRMTNAFFRADPWPYRRKTWSVYFRFVGSKRVQVVTGWEDGALEVPWGRF